MPFRPEPPDIRSGIDRKEAMDQFMVWLQSDKTTRGTEIPFVEEAIAFAAVYKQMAYNIV